MMTSAQLLEMLKNQTAPEVKAEPKTTTEPCTNGGWQNHSKRAIQVCVAILQYQLKDWKGLNEVARNCGGQYIPKGYIDADKEKTGWWFETEGNLNTFLTVIKNVNWEVKATAEEVEKQAEEKRMDVLQKIVTRAKSRAELERMKAYLDSAIVAIDSKTLKDKVMVPKKEEKPSMILKPVINK